MEGLGPTRGTPIRLDTIIVGANPYLIDLLCCRIAGFHHQKIRTLALAEKKGLLTKAHHRVVQGLSAKISIRPFKQPHPGPIAAFIHHPGRQKFFLKIRNTPFFTYLASTDWFGNLLFLTGLRQDVFLKNEMHIDRMALDENKCDRCGVCQEVCPMGLFFPDDFKAPGPCLKCLYCFAACPKRAISYTGEAGFFAEQERQYDDKIRAMFKKTNSA
jgi:ferredoxin